MKTNNQPVYYAEYLQLDKLLASQEPESVRAGKPAHDEMLFIIVHQAYELWFKQILHELDAVLATFQQEYIAEKLIGTAVSRLTRITEIQKILIDQLRVLETMTPLDFLDFRDLLVPASGFQSYQFRLIENKLGLKHKQRKTFGRASYDQRLSSEHQALVNAAAQAPSLLSLIEKWLERTPFLQFGDFDFWASYRQAVEQMLAEDRATITSNPTLPENEKRVQLRELEKTRESFAALFDNEKHEKLVSEGARALSLKANLAALLISLYRDEPILHLPFRLITVLIDIDELMTTWRYRHALMVERIIGSKIGTGGSSGFEYLRKTAESHKVFSDFFALSTYLIPRSALPALPQDVEKQLGFYYSRTR